MREEKDTRRRRSIRLPAYDYRWSGAYFVTVCAKNRECLFGRVKDRRVVPNEIGAIIESCWADIPAHFSIARLDAFVLMPNHVHGILILAEANRSTVGARHALPLQREASREFQKPPAESLSSVIGSFKSATTRRINLLRGTPGVSFWQRNYYEHIVRNEQDLLAIRQYIQDNPIRWDQDEENPERKKSQAERERKGRGLPRPFAGG